MKINTILFDLDGTLLDTNELIIQSYLHTLNSYYPNKYKREDVIPFMGPTLTEAFDSIDPDKTEEMIKRYRKFNHEQHDNLVTEFETVFETVKTLHEQGFKLAIVTTKIRTTVSMGLKLSKLDQFFDVIVTIDDVEHAKPHPQPVLMALEQLHSSPEDAIMVGDNHHDVGAGKSAGTKTAGVSWSAKGRDYMSSLNPDYLLDTMSDLLKIVGAK